MNVPCCHVCETYGATALALLPFLGAWQTHQSGAYRETVDKGLRFLIDHMRQAPAPVPASNGNGSWFEAQATMYSHCLATIALSEAYAMTGDSRLRGPGQAGIEFLVWSQHRSDGGWRYSVGARGNTSVVGWAIMALKSARAAGLDVPDETLHRTGRFLDRVCSNHDARGVLSTHAFLYGQSLRGRFSVVGLLDADHFEGSKRGLVRPA